MPQDISPIIVGWTNQGEKQSLSGAHPNNYRAIFGGPSIVRDTKSVTCLPAAQPEPLRLRGRGEVGGLRRRLGNVYLYHCRLNELGKQSLLGAHPNNLHNRQAVFFWVHPKTRYLSFRDMRTCSAGNGCDCEVGGRLEACGGFASAYRVAEASCSKIVAHEVRPLVLLHELEMWMQDPVDPASRRQHIAPTAAGNR
jgi:hypothetical protein